MSEVFLDTAYAIALSARGDGYHDAAVSLAKHLRVSGTKMVTTRAVLVEIGNSLSSSSNRNAAGPLLDALENDPNVEIVPLTDDLYKRGLDLFRERPDKEWGLTDCVSFVVMGDRGIMDALTTDSHFQQAGYRALMRENRI